MSSFTNSVCGYGPECPLVTKMLTHEILDQQITSLKAIVSMLEALRDDLKPMTLDEVEELWDDIDADHLKNANNFGDFIQIVKALQNYFNIGKRT